MGVSFTLLLIYPYGNRSQDELNRNLGSLQQWSKLGSKKTNPPGNWALQGHVEWVGAPLLISTGAPCVLRVSSYYILTCPYTFRSKHVHINAYKAKRQ